MGIMLLDAIKNGWENIFVDQFKKLTGNKFKRIALLKNFYNKAIPY